MDLISDFLQPYKDIIGKVAGAVTFCHMLSGSLVLYGVYKKKSSTGTPLMPFLGGFVLTVLSYKLATILNDGAILWVNILGFVLNVAYISIYYLYTPKKALQEVWKQFGISGAFIAGVLAYAEFEDPAKIEFRFGMIITVLMFSLISAPLLGLVRYIINKMKKQLFFNSFVFSVLLSVIRVPKVYHFL